ncbi:hypothetical protein BKA64DRAFT_626226 [Cadophora sp. MPI-SDFR-AT-0126]|nr:hypothetical protein BKA64DRAFT_626226 [Leotiomycetes sp. MPI-SDFR-AT-0126]
MTSTTDRPCTTSNSQKRKFEGEGGDHTLAKKLDIGDKKGITTGTKRRPEDDSGLHQSSRKRFDTGVGKIIDLTGEQSTSDTSATEKKEANAPLKDSGAAKAPGAEKRPKCCVSCADDFEPAYISQMPCKHDYCHFCVQRVVINSLVDEALYPPRCCKQPFDMDSMRQALTPELISGFYEKKTEFETTNRTYCSNPTCSAFLYPVNIAGDKASCPMCFTTTCTICKGPDHNGDCPQDTATQQVLALANTEGWKRCKNCKRMIELKHGCNHITCACRSEWCYICGVAWKNCRCEIWEENRLLDRANEIAARNPQPNGPARQHQVAAIARAVIENHECDHDDWERVDGEWECDECGDELPFFIWRCTQCDIDACTRCRYNVL